MALKLKQPGIQPSGQFDGADAIVTTVKGGEVGVIKGVSTTADLAAYDASGADGYVGALPGTRPVVTTDLDSGDRPLGLIDDGTLGYGTLFGSVLGATVGQESFGPGTTGTFLGPHTAAASGKLTFWMKPGTYAVTLDATDPNASTGLQVTHPTLAIGDALYATAAGLLTPTSGSAFEAVVLGRFLNFETNGSLVTTPISLASAANSPVGLPGVAQQRMFTEALFEFAPPIG